ncbi:MAG: HIT domain-containing protein [Spirochaetales bacterium]|nr:HIT domain-containing protein [Spirochaetales bacterium]
MTEGYFYNFEKLDYIRGKRPEGCILCRIIADDPEVVNLTVFRDERFAVSLNLYPFNPGHLLIFPVRHMIDMREYTPEEETHLTRLCRYILSILDVSHSPEGYNIGYNMGLVSGASIEHLHMHIIPRYQREVGMADLIAGKRVLVEEPSKTIEKLTAVIRQRPFSMSIT